MSLIPNYISRLRTHSQSTVATGSSTNTNTESRSASTLEPPLTEASTVGATTLHTIEELERKIHPDLDVLAAETAAELSALEPTGPVPPRRKAKSVPHLKEQGQQVGGEFKNDPPSPPKTPLLARILATRSQPVLSPNSDKDETDPPNWATFGRKGVPIISRISEFGSSHRRESSSKSSSTKTPKRRSVPPSSPSPSVPHVPSQPSSSPAGTVSSSSGSKAYSLQSHSVRSRRHPLNYPDPIPDIESSIQQSPSRSTLADHTFHPRTPPSKPFPDGAPNTFGRKSKRPIVTDGKEVDDDGAAVLFTPTRTSTPPPPERLLRREPPHTYPQRSRKRSMPRGRSVSLPRRLEHIFRKDDPLSELDLGTTRGGAGRLGASLFPSGNVMGQGSSWPEDSTREMVRLSRGGGEKGGDVQVGNPSFFGSIGRDRHAFLRAAQRKAIPSHLAATSRSSPALAKSAGGSESATLTSTTLFPRASVSKPLSITAGLSAMSDPGPALSESGFGSLYTMDLTGPVKRKMLDSQDDVTMQGSSSGGTRGILLNANRESSRPSDASHAPSSFRLPKRIRLSTPAVSGSSSPPMHTRSLSPSRPHSSYPSPPHSPTSRPPSSLRSFSSQASSLPVRAIVSPKPPSIVSRHSSYHMRDPALPPRKRESTQWTGAARKVLEAERDGSNGQRMFPLQAWAFMLGFLFFPVWWIAAVVPVRWGWAWRRGRGKQSGKGTREDGAVRETLEYDVAYTWRQRCRIISLLGLFVYIPLIVLLAVFVPRA